MLTGYSPGAHHTFLHLVFIRIVARIFKLVVPVGGQPDSPAGLYRGLLTPGAPERDSKETQRGDPYNIDFWVSKCTKIIDVLYNNLDKNLLL